jgi:FkbM family methyltransferase
MVNASFMLERLRWKLASYFADDLYEKRTLAGKQVTVYRGTIKAIPDYDDAWLAHLVSSYPVIYDIGANIGFTALLAKLYGNPLVLVLADPNAQALATASENLILNDLVSGCNFIPEFVSSKSGESIKFYTVGKGAAGSIFRTHARTAGRNEQWRRVKSTTVDEIANKLGAPPRLIKIDTEGAESLVLEGATHSAQSGAHFFVEMHSSPELGMKENAGRVLDWCARQRYAAWYLKESRTIGRPDEIANRGRCHLLLLPKGVPYPEKLRGVNQGDPLPES